MRSKLASAPGAYALIFSAIWLLHAPLLRLPYFWDEAGYYIPAARDLLLTGNPVPTSTLTNAHPPLVMAWLAFWWKFSAYTPAMTRTAMLLMTAFALLGLYRLARQVSNQPVAIATTLLTALYPPFFAQSTLAHLDMAAAALTLWGLSAWLARRHWQCVAWFALAGLAKETALLAPAVLMVVGFWSLVFGRRPEGNAEDAKDAEENHSKWMNFDGGSVLNPPRPLRPLRSFLALAWCALPLAGWYFYHYARTGAVFGNPEYFRYNLAATATPLRIVFALGQRCWQLFAGLNMFVLTGAALMALRFAPLNEGEEGEEQDFSERQPLAAATQWSFAAVIGAYLLALSVVGGAVLARYLLPVYPLVILEAASTLWRRLIWWKAAVAMVAVAFGIGLLASPHYRIAPEDNLTYASFVRLHMQAARTLADMPGVRVLTAWPASDELRKPYLGYVSRPVNVVPIENFTPENLREAARQPAAFDYALVFSTKYEPAGPFRSLWWEKLQIRYFDYHRDALPQEAAGILGGKIVNYWQSGAEWVALIRI